MEQHAGLSVQLPRDHDQLLVMSWQQVIENLSVDINIHKVVKN